MYKLQEVSVGEKIPMCPEWLDGKKQKTIAGTVIWIHPDGRFALVKFPNGIRECIGLVDAKKFPTTEGGR